ncbi:MAG: hypothetical protein AAFR76_01440 [Planctomycetota bacterium]
MRWLLALMVIGWAAEPPPRPVVATDLLEADPTRCTEAYAIRIDQVAPCRGVLLPVGELAQLEASRLGLEQLEARYRIDTATLAQQLAARDRQLELERADRARRTWQTVGLVAAGAVTTAAISVAHAHSLPRR